VRGPELVPHLRPRFVGFGGHTGGGERAIRPAAVGGQRRDERRPPGGVVGVVVARHRDQTAGGVGQVGAEGSVSGAAAGNLDGSAEPAGLLEHRQAAAALQDNAVHQGPGQMLPAMAEVKADDGAGQRGIPQRALLARRQVGKQDGGGCGIRPRRQLEQVGRGQVAAEEACQPADSAARGEQVHLQAPAASRRQRRDQEPVVRVEDQPVGDAENDAAGARDVGHLALFADAEPERAEYRVGRAEGDRDSGAAQPGRRFGPQRTAGVRRPHGRQSQLLASAGQAGRGQDVGVPAIPRQFEAAVAGCGARVGSQLAGQPGEQVVLGRRDGHGGGRPGRVSLGDPGEHRQQVAAVHPLAGQPV
jgi:hypothetical protein